MTCKWLTGKHCKEDMMYGPSAQHTPPKSETHTHATKKSILENSRTFLKFFSPPAISSHIIEICYLMFDTVKGITMLHDPAIMTHDINFL